MGLYFTMIVPYSKDSFPSKLPYIFTQLPLPWQAGNVYIWYKNDFSDIDYIWAKQ